MTGRHRSGGPTRRRVDVHVASVLGRARADAGPLLLAVVVVSATVLLSAVTPRLVERTADTAVRTAVTDAGPDAQVVAAVPFVEDEGPTRLRTETVADVEDVAVRLENALPAELRDVLGPPVATVSTARLTLLLPEGERGSTALTFTSVRSDGPPEVRFVAGRAAQATITPAKLAAAPDDAPPPVVEVALSEPAAALLQVGPGDPLTVLEADSDAVAVTVSGIFRPVERDDPAWASAPGLLEPRVRGTGLTTETVVAGLVSDEALPVARLVVEADRRARTSRTYTFAPDPAALSAGSADDVVRALAGLQATPLGIAVPGARVTVESHLGDLLEEVDGSIRAARAQAAVLLTGVVAAAALALVLVARLVVRRRAAVLAHRRARGGTLAGVAVELLAESAAVAAAGGALGLTLAALAAPGPVPWPWVAPVLLVTAAAGPVLAVVASARATGGRRRPANLHQRRALGRARTVRRLAAEVAVVAAAAGAVAALRARGAVESGADLLTAAAPTLTALAGAVLLLRAVPPLTAWALARGVRGRGLVPVLAGARAHATARDALPFVALAVAGAVATLAWTVGATVHHGQESASWADVGADVTATSVPDEGLDGLARDLADAPGVTAAAAVAVHDAVQARGEDFGRRVRVVVADPADLARLAAAAPALGLPEAPLTDAGAGPSGGARALVAPDLAGAVGSRLSATFDDGSRSVVVVGTANLAPGTVLVDASDPALADVAVPDTVWVVGAGARAAVAVAPALADADVVERAAVLAERRAAPLTQALAALTTATGVVLLALVALVVVVAAATGAPARGATLARLRTLGLTRREVHAVTAGELAPPALLACATAVGVGALVAAVCTAPLGLRLLTGQAAEPSPVVPWWSAAPVLVAGVTVVVVVAVESSLRRRERLGEVLRVGG